MFKKRRAAVVVVSTVLAALAAAPATALAAPPDRQGTVRLGDPFAWNGDLASGANVNYDSDSGTPCSETNPATKCDATLINVDVSSTFWRNRGGGLQISLDDYRPNPSSDFDLYVYRSNANGDRGKLVGSSAAIPGAEETTTIDGARGYYLVQVVYFAVTNSQYTGTAELVVRPKVPLDIDRPSGLQERLASNPALGFRSHSEPHIAQSPLNPNLLIAASKQYNRDPDSLAEYEFKVGSYVSFDGGVTWTDLGQTNVCPQSQAPPSSWPDNKCYPRDNPKLGGTNEEDVKDPQGEQPEQDQSDPRGSGDFGEEYIVSDPWVDFDDEGNAYLMVLDSPPFETGAGWGMSFHRWRTPSRSDVRRGSTWSNRIPINKYDDPVTQREFLDDKNTFAVNNVGGNRDGKIGPMVACWGQNIQSLIKQQTVCETSRDGGRSWPEAPKPISGLQQLVIGVHVVADHEDPQTFYAIWLQYATEIIGGPGTYEFSMTRDGGETWEPPRTIQTANTIPRTFPGQAFRNLSLPIMAVGPRKPGPAPPELYLTYAEYLDAPRPGDADGKQSDIRLIRSEDQGRTWSEPTTVNGDGTNADQFQQYIRVTPGGQLNVSYFDRRLDRPRMFQGQRTAGNYFIDLWLSRSRDGGRSFRDVRLSHDSWDPSINPPISGSGEFIGDYQGLVVNNRCAIAFANDTHLANSRTRDPRMDRGMPRSRFQEVFAWRVPNTRALAGSRTRASCPTIRTAARRRTGPRFTG